jgi:hypothetical protein
MNQAEEMQALEEFWKPVVPAQQQQAQGALLLSFSLFPPLAFTAMITSRLE